MNTVSPIKVKLVSNSLLKNNFNYKQAMLENGYSENTANMGADNKVVREALAKINQETAKKCTPEFVISSLLNLAEHAIKQADKLKALELLGKYLALFTDKQISDVNINDDERNILRRYGLTQ